MLFRQKSDYKLFDFKEGIDNGTNIKALKLKMQPLLPTKTFPAEQQWRALLAAGLQFERHLKTLINRLKVDTKFCEWCWEKIQDDEYVETAEGELCCHACYRGIWKDAALTDRAYRNST